jgi:hypothetical protein
MYDFGESKVEYGGTCFLGKLQAMDEERKTNKETSVETKQRDFLKREHKEPGNTKEESRQEYHQDVKHITYDRRQIKHPRSPLQPKHKPSLLTSELRSQNWG